MFVVFGGENITFTNTNKVGKSVCAVKSAIFLFFNFICQLRDFSHSEKSSLAIQDFLSFLYLTRRVLMFLKQ